MRCQIVRLKKTRFREVLHEESMGIAKRDARGRVIGARSAERDIFRFFVCLLDWVGLGRRRRVGEMSWGLFGGDVVHGVGVVWC